MMQLYEPDFIPGSWLWTLTKSRYLSSLFECRDFSAGRMEFEPQYAEDETRTHPDLSYASLE